MTTDEAHALGVTAYGENRPSAPTLDPDIRAAIADMPVGGGALDLFRAFAAGYRQEADRAAAEVLGACGG